MLIELRLAVAVGMCLAVLVIQQLTRHMQLAVAELLTEVGQQTKELLHALVGVGRTACMEHAFQHRVVCLEQILYLPAVGLDGLHVAIDCILVDW